MSTKTTPPQDDLDGKLDKIADLAAAVTTTNLTVVLDRSGSMSSIRSDVVGGLNSLVEEQKQQPGSCTVTLWQFDDVAVEKVYGPGPVADVPTFGNRDFIPRGSTPLYDAVGSALAEAEARHQDGDAEIIVIITDGKENASKEHTKEQIFKRITDLQKGGWVFSYLGAGHDAYEAGASIGVAKGSTQSFAANSAGASKSFASVSRAAGQYRSAMAAGGQTAAAYGAAAVTDFFGGTKEAEEDMLGSSVPPQIVKPSGFDDGAIRAEAGQDIEQGSADNQA